MPRTRAHARLAARVVAASAAALLAATLLVACDGYQNHPSDGGQRPAEVGAALEAVPGIVSADAYSFPWYNPGEGGLFSSRGVDLLLWVAVDPEKHIADGEEFLRTVAAAAWSINDGYSPDGDVVLLIRGGLDIDYDWDAAAATVFGEGQAVRNPEVATYHIDQDLDITDRDVVIGFADGMYQRAFGDWPAAPPDVPSGLIADGAPAPVDPPAAAWFRVRTETVGDTCVRVSFERAVNDDGEMYHGDVTVTVMYNGAELATEVAPGSADDEFGGDQSVQFCEGSWIRPARDYSAHVVAPAAPGFRGVDRSGVTYDW